MRKIVPTLLLLAALTAPLAARAAEWPESPCTIEGARDALSQRLDKLLAKAPSLKGARYGLRFITAPDGLPIYDKDPDKLFVPASSVKLITGAAALQNLGHEFTYPTEIYGQVSSDGATVVGPLYIKGYGDPSLVSERLYLLAQSIASRGISHIDGDLVVDDTYFDDERFNPKWRDNSTDRSYLAATGAVSVNFNAITIVVRPGSHVGDAAVVTTEPEVPLVLIDSKVKTVEGSSVAVDASRTMRGERPRIELRGRIGIGASPKRFFKNVPNPGLYAGHLIAAFLKDQGITLSGNIRRDEVPEGAPLLERTESKPLALIVRDLNKFSNNFVAEQLVKTLGASQGEPPGTWKSGLEVLGRFLGEHGAPAGGWKLYDGSGLSDDNQLSPRTLTQVLRTMFNDHRLRPEYEASLSVGGADGTVRRRFSDETLARRVRAKTGHLAAVSALAGYLYPQGMRPLAFAVLVNGFRGGFPDVEADVDGLVSEVLHACTQPESAHGMLKETVPQGPTP